MRALFAGPSRLGLVWPVRVRTPPLLHRPPHSSFSTSRVSTRRSHLNALDPQTSVRSQAMTILDKLTKLHPKRPVVIWHAGDLFPGEVSLYRSPRQDKRTTMEQSDSEDTIDQLLDTPEMRASNRQHAKEIFSTMRRRIKAYYDAGKQEERVKPFQPFGQDHDHILSRIKDYLDGKKTASALSLAHLYLNSIWENAPRVEPGTEDTPAVDPPLYPEATGRGPRGPPRAPVAPHPLRHLKPAIWLKCETMLHLRDTYDYITRLFLDVSNEGNLVAVGSLLERQHQEGIPVTHPMARTIFRLDNLPVPLETALGVLPPMDPELMGLSLQAVIREKRPTPTLVRNAIVECLQAGEEPTDQETWHWELRVALLYAYIATSTYKDALQKFMEFVQVVKKTKAEALENNQRWPDERQDTITRMYTQMVIFWIRCATSVPDNLPDGAKVPPRIRRQGSIVPAHLFMDLVQVLSPGTSGDALNKVHVSRQFLVQYINAERVAGNINTAIRVWEKISEQTYAATLAGQQPPSQLDDRLWEAFLRLLKVVEPPPPPSAYRALATVVPPGAQSKLLSAAASGRAGVDIQLIMVLLANLPPGEREFDVAAAALIRSARLPGYYPSMPHPYRRFPIVPPPIATQPSQPTTVTGERNARTNSHLEWMWVRKCIANHTSTRPPRLPLSFVKKREKATGSTSGPMFGLPFIKFMEEAPDLGIAIVADFTRALLRVMADLLAHNIRLECFKERRPLLNSSTHVHYALSEILVRQDDEGPPASIADKFCEVIYPTQVRQNTTSTADVTTSPAHSSTPPADSSTPPADSSTPPAHSSTPPADSSTPPA